MPMRQYKYLTLIAMISAIVLPCATITLNKIIPIGYSSASAGTLTMPLWFILGDIITEVYGYKISRQIFWYALLCNFLFAVFTTLLVDLPSPKSWMGGYAYSFVFGNMMHIVCGAFIALMIGSFINNYLLSKWKVLVRGKYFWLRSLGSSTVGEAVYTIIAGLLIFTGKLPFGKMAIIIMWSYFFKIVGSILLSGPANLIVIYLKKKEGLDTYDVNVDFNPFKLST